MENKQNIYKQIVKLAIEILENKIGMIEGARELVNINAFYLEDKNHLFNIFKVINSDTIDYPIGESRKYWNQQALEKLDIEIKDYVSDIKKDVDNACKMLIEEFS